MFCGAIPDLLTEWSVTLLDHGTAENSDAGRTLHSFLGPVLQNTNVYCLTALP
jgi:hypothetical protein